MNRPPSPVHTTEYLQVRDLTIRFDTPRGPFTAVKNINLTIARGQTVALIGHSGCGKSTLLNAIGGLVKPSAGEIVLGGVTIDAPGPDRGIVFQNYSLLPWLTVYQNIFEAVDSVRTELSKRDKAATVESFLQKVNLWEHRDKKPAQLSGGMKQRVAIARAFAIHPEVLLLDEPFGALDALTKSSLHEELVKLLALENQTDTVLIVTHDIEEAIFLSDKIVVMTNGPAAVIGEVIEVNIPGPRDKRSIVHLKEYVEVHDRLLYLLMDAFAVHKRAAA
ncbi:MAG: ABC transporter ATP-binding protein [Acidobacteria bacterium]|nr:ABC transporter ATP-binding protein [Acidobacteriota bacterium]MBI3425421.1 ABC transporter ATP-binding protein [Acidobacteriota bacterium]